MMARAVCLVPVLLLAFIPVTIAQPADTSELHGTVTDQTGGVIVGAAVTIHDDAGGISETTTDGQGHYVFGQLRPAAYTVSIASEGFKEFSGRVRLRPRAVTTL